MQDLIASRYLAPHTLDPKTLSTLQLKQCATRSHRIFFDGSRASTQSSYGPKLVSRNIYLSTQSKRINQDASIDLKLLPGGRWVLGRGYFSNKVDLLCWDLASTPSPGTHTLQPVARISCLGNINSCSEETQAQWNVADQSVNVLVSISVERVEDHAMTT